MVRNEIPSVFLLFKMIQKGIPSIVYLTRKGSEQNYEVLSVFLVYKMVRNCIPSTFVFFRNGSERNFFKFRCFLFTKSFRTEFRTFFYLPRNGSERNSERFPFRKTDGNPTEKTKISVFLGKWHPPYSSVIIC